MHRTHFFELFVGGLPVAFRMLNIRLKRYKEEEALHAMSSMNSKKRRRNECMCCAHVFTPPSQQQLPQPHTTPLAPPHVLMMLLPCMTLTGTRRAELRTHLLLMCQSSSFLAPCAVERPHGCGGAWGAGTLEYCTYLKIIWIVRRNLKSNEFGGLFNMAK